MRARRVVTSFLRYQGTVLIVRRSRRVSTMQGMWSGISGSIEGDESPMHRARAEIREETGIVDIRLARQADAVTVRSPEGLWQVWPFLFDVDVPDIALNWENSEYRWIAPGDISGYSTVPGLDEVLSCLL